MSRKKEVLKVLEYGILTSFHIDNDCKSTILLPWKITIQKYRLKITLWYHNPIMASKYRFPSLRNIVIVYN